MSDLKMDHKYLMSIGLNPKEQVSYTITKPGAPGEAAPAAAASTAKESKDSTMSKTASWPRPDLSAKEIRKMFVDYFVKKNGHSDVPSALVIPHDDPTLMFINSGMAQFKPVFQGQIDPNHPYAKLKRAANTQKCIRAGGKHNDLDDVGKDVYHHTFFEMLGNWSFGDYFKKEAIDWAWDLLTNVYGLPKDRLYATYYDYDPSQPDVPADLEAKALWERYLPPHKVLPGSKADNFWEMGDTGPCGPCSELHFDRIGGRNAASLVNMDDPDVLEVWNLVFMDRNRKADGSLEMLPASNVDTGMGFERIVSCIQNLRSNYDSDIFTVYFDAIQKICGCRPYSGKVGKDDTDGVDMAYRVIADHIRTLTIAITDGAAPGSKGRSSVLQSILRRAVRYGHEFLNAPEGFLSQLVDVVVDSLGDAFPNLKENPADVKTLILSEEIQFSKTLAKGISEFKKRAEKAEKNMLAAKDAFDLYTSFGFPIDLTERMCEEKDMSCDVAGYNVLFEKFKEDSKKKAAQGETISLELVAKQTSALINDMKVARTDDSMKYQWESARGDGPEQKAKILAIYNGEQFVDKISNMAECGFILDKTTVYGESGGQTFDTADIKCEGKFAFSMTSAKAYAGYLVHKGKMEFGEAAVGDSVVIKVDYGRRACVAKNHTATHILNFALRQVLGGTVDQKGSSVKHEAFSFDFNSQKQMTEDQLREVERIVHEVVHQKQQVTYQTVPLDTAMKINGLRAVFGEKYPDPVRVVSIGADIPAMIKDPEKTPWGLQHSVEFCGGTHLGGANEIFKFTILTEEPNMKGVRRVTACCAQFATAATSLKIRPLKDKLEEAMGFKGALLDQRVTEMRRALADLTDLSLLERRNLEKKVDDLKVAANAATKGDAKKLLGVAKELAEKIPGPPSPKDALVAKMEGLEADAKALGAAEQMLVRRFPDSPICMISPSASKIMVVCIVPKALSSKVSAKEWFAQVGAIVGAKGGGSPMKAQGGGPDVAKLEEAMASAKAFCVGKL